MNKKAAEFDARVVAWADAFRELIDEEHSKREKQTSREAVAVEVLTSAVAYLHAYLHDVMDGQVRLLTARRRVANAVNARGSKNDQKN